MYEMDAAARRAALRLARATIEADLAGRSQDPAPVPALELPAGAFVTLHKAGHLRGCIGRMEADEPLWRVIVGMARAAAFGDPRFPPLKPDEWPQCELEISVLTPARPVAGPGEVELGRHGIVLHAAGRRAVFLPQVAAEQGWTLEETLTRLARKAGLPPDAWRRPDCRLEVFEALILREGTA